MKKKALGKLTLSKQTVTNLENKELSEVRGGEFTNTCRDCSFSWDYNYYCTARFIVC